MSHDLPSEDTPLQISTPLKILQTLEGAFDPIWCVLDEQNQLQGDNLTYPQAEEVVNTHLRAGNRLAYQWMIMEMELLHELDDEGEPLLVPVPQGGQQGS